jgi:hypothetical protein
MNDTRAVRAVERIGNLRAELEHVGGRKRTACDAIRQRLAFDQLHHEIVDVALAADVGERADVRMFASGDRLRFALEARAPGIVDRCSTFTGVAARRESRARYTSPMPPAPSGERIS